MRSNVRPLTCRCDSSHGPACWVENHDPVKCPLCQGHGELLRSEVIKQLTNGELKPWIDAYRAEIAQLEPLTELATASASGSRDFQEDVHTWNPELPMWRRSPKE